MQATTITGTAAHGPTPCANIPENAPIRASSSAAPADLPNESASPPNVLKLPFRESSSGKRKPPRKPKNSERRSREFLTEQEVERLRAAASKTGRHGPRDALMVLLAYRHGLRVGELVNLKWDQVDFAQALLYVRRMKKGNAATHPLSGAELRGLRQLKRDYPEGPYLFQSERGGPLTTSAFRKLIARAGELAGIRNAHPHQLRHGCGFDLANRGIDTRSIQAFLGHRQIQHTTVYTQLSPERFKDFWQD
jgi:integrase